MHPPEVKQAALDLIAAGHNDCEVSRRLGVPRPTIRDWRRPRYVSRRSYPMEICLRCWRACKPIRFTTEDYAELLAVYLGDGCISETARTQRLRISLDTKYPGIIEETRALLVRCFPTNPVDTIPFHKGSCVNLSVYSSHLSCLFPQHGRGPKHLRVIRLEPWQEDIVNECPWPFIRGCIRTDGCVFVNRTGPYEYLSYEFGNMSGDIVDLFLDACRRVGVFTRANQSQQRGIWSVRINRRGSVALMQKHVGMKT
jgi:hypothetical protein